MEPEMRNATTQFIHELVSRGMARLKAEPDGKTTVEADVHVAGFRHHDGMDIIPYLQPGETLDLIPEPGNPYDEWAIRVEHKKSRIGYVPRAINRPIAMLLQASTEVTASISEMNPKSSPWECLKMRLEIRLNHDVENV